MSVDPSQDYPLAQRHPEWVTSPSGLPFQEITLKKVLAGEVSVDDLRITAETLRRQAEIAEATGRAALAANLRRAAELTTVPNERLLAVYNALRPRRATRQELEALCDELEATYGAAETVAFIRAAIPVYEAKGLFRHH